MHDNTLLKKLCPIVEADINAVVMKGQILPTDWENLSNAVDILKDIKTIEAMEESRYNQNEVSGMMYPPRYMNSYDNGYSNGNSYERGRSSVTGRYISRDDEISSKLNRMMSTARDENERETIRRVMIEMGL